jgi:signal transduction histidine kinase
MLEHLLNAAVLATDPLLQTPLIDLAKTGAPTVLCALLVYMIVYQTPQHLKSIKEQADSITAIVKQALDASTEEQASMRKTFATESTAMRAAFTAQYETLAKRFETALAAICERGERSDDRLMQLIRSQLDHQHQHQHQYHSERTDGK